MERATRLRRYLRKDYTQIVEFPVEIVGRDGMVRRYSFDDSVRLYHRRIHSAAMRYDDGELVDAEVRHCRQRIDQLRRSYLEHFGWASLRDAQLGAVLAGPLAAEVAAFLRRAFSAERDGPAALRITLVDSGVCEVFYLRCSETGRSWVLYAWRVDAAGPTGARDAWRSTLKRLASAPEADGVERLLLAMESPDLILALAGSGEWTGPSGVDFGGAPDGEPADPLHAGTRAIYDGQPAEALVLLEAALDASPGRLALAQAAALVALLENEPDRAEFAARYGLSANPHDTLLAYLLGLALCRTGRLEEARAGVDNARRSAPRAPMLKLLAGAIALRTGHFLRAWLVLRTITEREGRYPARTALTLRAWLSRGAVVFASAVVLLASSVVLWQEGSVPVAVFATAVAVSTSLHTLVATGRRVRALLGPERVAGVPRMVSLELLPRERDLANHH